MRALHLEDLAAVRVGAGIHAGLEALPDDHLDVGAGQRQSVAEALVPGLEGAQALRVLVQARCQGEEQPVGAMPAPITRTHAHDQTRQDETEALPYLLQGRKHHRLDGRTQASKY